MSYYLFVETLSPSFIIGMPNCYGLTKPKLLSMAFNTWAVTFIFVRDLRGNARNMWPLFTKIHHRAIFLVHVILSVVSLQCHCAAWEAYISRLSDL